MRSYQLIIFVVIAIFDGCSAQSYGGVNPQFYRQNFNPLEFGNSGINPAFNAAPFAFTPTSSNTNQPPPFLVSAAYLKSRLGPQNFNNFISGYGSPYNGYGTTTGGYNALNSGYDNYNSGFGFNPNWFGNGYNSFQDNSFYGFSTDSLATAGCTWDYIHQICVDAQNSCRGSCRDVTHDAALDAMHDCHCAPTPGYGSDLFVQRSPFELETKAKKLN